MSAKKIKIEVWHCVCDKCEHAWNSQAGVPPAYCPSCKTREWNGIKRRGRPPIHPKPVRADLPRPKRVRSVEL